MRTRKTQPDGTSLRRATAIVAVLALLPLPAAFGAEPSGDAVEAGQKLFRGQCAACHTLEAAGPSAMGPNLHGLFGRKAGTAPGYKCSAALQGSGIVWDDATLDKYLTNPRGLVPGGKMSLPRIADGAKRAALIAYLKAATR